MGVILQDLVSVMAVIGLFVCMYEGAEALLWWMFMAGREGDAGFLDEKRPIRGWASLLS